VRAPSTLDTYATTKEVTNMVYELLAHARHAELNIVDPAAEHRKAIARGPRKRAKRDWRPSRWDTMSTAVLALVRR
jgi:post-segregation antitoxin (ccd killing protein)